MRGYSLVMFEHRKQVLMIALDAAEPGLLEKWMSEGLLPNLNRLRERGTYCRLESSADWLAGSPWPTFYTGTTPAEHGLYHFMQWRSESMSNLRPSPEWLSLRPFWHDLSDTGRRTIVIDLPMTFPPLPFNGIEVSGWSTHDRLAPPASYPTEMLEWIGQEFGRTPLKEEVYGQQRCKALLELRDDLIWATYAVAELAKTVARRETWDLFMIGFGATHRGGHKLWDSSGVRGNVQPDEQDEISHALLDIYIACDTAIGKLVESVPDKVTVLVFSLHGMGPNTCRIELLPEMLSRILNPDTNTDTEESLSAKIRKSLEIFPLEWRLGVKRLLPSFVQDRLTESWFMGKIDWTLTTAFSLVADLQGYIRINLRGREAAGIVEPGEEYDRLCAKISKGLATFVDADTKEPVVKSIKRADELFAEGSKRSDLPDLLVNWQDTPTINHRTIESPVYGSIQWPTPGRNSDGRSGNHRPQGFLLAAGDHIKRNSTIKNGHILDLAPTVLSLLDVPKPDSMAGCMLSTIRID